MKKRIISLLLALVMCLGLMLPASASTGTLSGTYTGYYYANQGQTGLTLTILSPDKGIFEFYNLEGHTNAEPGSYYVSISYEGDRVIIKGTEWIEKPSTYSFVSLYGTVNGTEFSGKVDNSSSWPFYLTQDTTSEEIPDVDEPEVPGISTNIPAEAVGYNGHYYMAYTDYKTWSDAQAFCESLGGHLVTITSQEEQSFLEGYLSYKDKNCPSGKYMIGMYRTITGFDTWVTGEPVTYTNWGKAEPDNLGKRQDTVIFNNGSTIGSGGSSYQINFGQWDDDNNSSYRFICEWDGISTSFGSETSRWSTPEMEKAYELNLIPDRLVGENLKTPITRLEFAAVSVKVYESLSGTAALPSIVNPFYDCNDVEMLKAYNVGITNGMSSVTFEPNLLLNREQAATMLTRVFKRVTIPGWSMATDSQYTLNYTMPAPFADDAKISGWAKDSVYFMAANGIINGMGNNLFAPRNTTSAEEANQYANATREQALAIAVRMVENLG